MSKGRKLWIHLVRMSEGQGLTFNLILVWYLYNRVGKVWNWSNLVLIKVVVFFITFDKNFVWTKYFFHTYGFLSLEGPLLAGLCSREPSPVSRACSKVKKPYVWKKYFVQTNFLSNLVKKSTTFINTKLLQFHTLPTLLNLHQRYKMSKFEVKTWKFDIL